MGFHGGVIGVLWVLYRISWGCHGILWDILDILYTASTCFACSFLWFQSKASLLASHWE